MKLYSDKNDARISQGWHMGYDTYGVTLVTEKSPLIKNELFKKYYLKERIKRLDNPFCQCKTFMLKRFI